jgi:hypothetical protein
MRTLRRSALPLLLCLSPTVASALDMLPGVWEVSTDSMQVGGQTIPGTQEMLEQLQSLPPDRRQRAEAGFAKQGFKLVAGGMQRCLTAEQIKAQEIPLHAPKSGCSYETLDRSATLWKFRFACYESQGEGEIRFASNKAFTIQTHGTYSREPFSMEGRARWVGADCGSLRGQ